MTVEAKKHELAGYRIKQAEESLDEARFLLAGKKSPREETYRFKDVETLVRDFLNDIDRARGGHR